MDEKDFFKGKYFDLLMENLDDIKKIQKEQGDTIDEINAKMRWVWGFAAGVAFCSSFLISWLKSKFFK